MTTSSTNAPLPAGYKPLPNSGPTDKSSLSKAAEQKELFLSLLVAQLKNQDPTSPMDQKDMMAQMAQFTSVEQLTNLASTMQSLQASAVFSQSISLIGKSIDFIQGEEVITGKTVTAVTSSRGITNLVLSDGSHVAPADVVRVS